MAWIYVYPVRYLSYLIPVKILIWLTRGLAPLYARLRGDLVAPIKQQMTRAFEGQVMPAAAAVMARSVFTGAEDCDWEIARAELAIWRPESAISWRSWR